MKVFRLNDFDWVAAETLENAVDWYVKETGIDKEDALDPAYEPHEVSLKTTVWSSPEDYLTEEEQGYAREYKKVGNELLAQIPFSRILEKENKSEPFIVASTEY
jgi:hypothetical protein